MQRKLVLLLVILFSVLAVASVDIASQYINGLYEGRFEEIYQMQDETMKKAQPVTVLKNLKTQLDVQLGKPIATLDIQQVQQGEYMVYVLATEFKVGIFDFIVTLNTEGKVAGFFVRPSSYKKAETQPVEVPEERPLPDYANPANYTEQNITVGKEPYYLPARLMVPNGLESYPIVIILQGSGTHDIDGTLGPNKPYRDLAAGLASRGIATLRYPKKYYVYPQQAAEIGINADAEYIEDALTIIAQMKGIPQFSSIYLAGHSMGGMVAPWIAQEAGVDGMILLAGSPVKFAQISLDQNLDLVGDQLSEEQKAQVKDFFTKMLNQEIPPETDLGQGITAGYYYSFDGYFCMPVLEETEMPVLVVNAELDFQTPKKYFDIFVEKLGDRPNITLKLLPGLNHIFNETDGTIKSVEEYDRPGYVAVELIDLLESWIKEAEQR
ncbi:MAG: DUF3887 domain-containing protein [Thermotogota bacterium]|nr:DUF3887 domain-containing protein [Thermotogota bacterium]